MNQPADTTIVMRTNGRPIREDRDGLYFIRMRLINEERTRIALEKHKTKVPLWAA